ncbi:hypothetical protein ASE99_22865 [Serratia sp. Leaf51]|nr:hypothetical protein ASE99_22865 [Serratia sp. Leaf51]
MTGMNVVPLCIADVAYYSNHAAQYLQNLLNTVDALPFLQQVIDELSADPAVGWNRQTSWVLGGDNVHAIELEIAPIHDYGDYNRIWCATV